MAARNEESMAFDRVNYRLLLIGIGIVILGYVLMSGGGSGDPNMFDATEVFSTRRITVAPLVCLIGYVFVAYAIMRKSRAEQ
jgi:uncharacterized membrane protein YidH (DUF202 family)